jgi:alpha-tubulin suppressor-like RCC1 family protein
MDDVTVVAAGSEYSLAIKSDSSLWAWGDNESGQLGDGSYKDSPNPKKIMDNVCSVAAGSGYVTKINKVKYEITQPGHTYHGSYKGHDLVLEVPPSYSSTPITYKSFNGNFSLAIKNDGSLWTWGRNNYGQLGDGTTKDRTEPAMIIDGVKAVAAGALYSLALRKDGSLWAWGNNYSNLGEGPGAPQEYPVKVMDNVMAVAASNYGTKVLKMDGSLCEYVSEYSCSSAFALYLPQPKPELLSKSTKTN